MRRTMLVFFILLFTSVAYTANIDYPLPKDAESVVSKDSTSGPMNMHLNIYKTAMSKDRLLVFFRQLLTKDGWQESKEMFFKKGDRILIIAVSPATAKSKEGKTIFTVTQSNMPSREEMLATKKDIPDKVSFMPIYPGARQMFLFDNPHGASASYATEDSIKDVIFFYESKMLGYGWTLQNESPVTERKYDSKENMNVNGSTKSVELKFTRDRENCTIHIYEGKLKQQQVAPVEKDADKTQVSGIMSPLGKTQILVTYNDFRKL